MKPTPTRPLLSVLGVVAICSLACTSLPGATRDEAPKSPAQICGKDAALMNQLSQSTRDAVDAACISAPTDENGDPDEETQIVMIDGGTEGFAGQARVIKPFTSGCYECTKRSLPPQQTFPMCTIRETPRIAAHCIQYAYVVEWENKRKGEKVDKDDPAHMQWICDEA